MKELEVAKKLCLEAGNEIMKIYESDDFEVTLKQDENNSPLTKADLAANKIIMEGLKKEFPDHGLLTEEEKDNKERLEKEFVWIIDPIDGTKEFIKKNGEFTVNIGLVKGEEVILGVVYAPAKDWLFFATKGNGAFLQKGKAAEQIHVSKRNKINEMILGMTRSHPNERILSIINKNKFGSVIKCGSSLKDCLVAKGDVDINFSAHPSNEWDVCAMDIIVKEAGGMVTDLEGNVLKYNQNETLLQGFLASNNQIHKELLKLK